uniref:Uncharacterized protein n=1 Tax=Anguilla anguilla TaxID=7936 RepID=A0A0E9S0N2_ANGAN
MGWVHTTCHSVAKQTWVCTQCLCFHLQTQPQSFVLAECHERQCRRRIGL